jgi:hypothetical protein
MTYSKAYSWERVKRNLKNISVDYNNANLKWKIWRIKIMSFKSIVITSVRVILDRL